MGKTLTTTTEVITALGGNKAVEKLVGARYPQQVSNWHSSPTFPSRFREVMKAALEAKGVTAPPSLWGQVAAQDQAAAS